MSATVESPIAAGTFYSILYNDASDRANGDGSEVNPPDYFMDLNLGQVVNAMTAGREEYDLIPFFYTPLCSRDTILYRQQVMQDLEKPALSEHIALFSKKMQEMRQALSYASKSQYKHQKERLFLDSVRFYIEAINSLSYNLSHDQMDSPGLSVFREYLNGYITNEPFTSLFEETEMLTKELSSVRYCIQTKELLVRVLPYHSETDYSNEVEILFEKFKQSPVKDYRMDFPYSSEMNHVEAAILKGVAELYPALFQRLNSFYDKNQDYRDKIIVAFEREIHFYVAFLEYIATIKKSGLPFCYPRITCDSKDIYNEAGFDLALAHKLASEGTPVVTNDFYLKDKERIIIVTGPNQGGKTTFARTFGQLHYMACLGCAVPGNKSELFLFDRLLTHFEKEEDISTHRSKFEDDLLRLYGMMRQATSNSIIIMNEILSSTTLQDAILLSKAIMEKIAKLDALCVWVTFIDELIPLSDKTVSMTSMVEQENPAARTFKVVRRPSDGLAYALSIAEKYRVTYTDLKNRLKL